MRPQPAFPVQQQAHLGIIPYIPQQQLGRKSQFAINELAPVAAQARAAYLPANGACDEALKKECPR
jgi:hypothetical protein